MWIVKGMNQGIIDRIRIPTGQDIFGQDIFHNNKNNYEINENSTTPMLLSTALSFSLNLMNHDTIQK